MVIIILIFMY